MHEVKRGIPLDDKHECNDTCDCHDDPKIEKGILEERCSECDTPLKNEYGANEVAEDGITSTTGWVCDKCGFAKEIKIFHTSTEKKCASGDNDTNPFEIIEGDSGYHNILVGRILQLMGKQSNDTSAIDYLYMTKIIQELVKR